jgi:hypothetical protein
MAITWKKLAFEDDVIKKSIINAKGDLIVGSAENTPSILSVGSDDSILVADSNESLGVKWKDFPQSFFQKASMYRSGTSQSIPNNTWTKVQLNAVSFDPYSICDVSNYRIKPTKAGYYLVIGYGSIDLAGGRVFIVIIYKNGSVLVYGTDVALLSSLIGYTRSIVSQIVYMDGSTDYLELWCYQESGSARSLLSGSENTYLSIVGPL